MAGKAPDQESLAFYEDAKRKAHALFLQGFSLRDIAAQVLPGRSGGFVTIQRWSVAANEEGVTWKQEREQLEIESREADREKYLEKVRQVKDANLRIAAKAMLAADMALDAYFVRDPEGTPVGIRTNQYGNPIITPRDLAPMLNAINDIHMRTLGMDQLNLETVQQMVAQDAPQVVEAVVAPEVLQRLGDQLALNALVVESAPPKE